MKKLTAGIFTVLIGLCAANSADAAIASKAWVEQYAVDTASYATDKSTLESSITDAKKAGTDAATALGEYKTANDAAVLANTNAISAINNETTGILKQAKDYTDALADGQVATNKNDIATINETLKSVATTEGLNTLTNTVAGHTTAINTLNGDANTDGSVSKSIADAVTALKNGEIKANADAIGALEGLVGSTSVDSQIDTKIDALNLETTYQTIGNMKNAITDGMTAAEKQATYPTIALLEKQIDTSGQAINSELAGIASDVNSLQQTVSANKQAADAVAERVTTAEGEIDALQAADTAISDKIGTVTEGKTVVQMIEAAQTAATYDDAEVKADIAANATAAANAQSAADAAQETANAAIPAPTGTCAEPTNKCVLTYNNSVYEWEVIERADNE